MKILGIVLLLLSVFTKSAQADPSGKEGDVCSGAKTTQDFVECAKNTREQVKKQGGSCEETAFTTQEIIGCLQTKLHEEESTLQALERKISSHLSPNERSWLEQSQLAWSSYLFANCGTAYSGFADGTIGPVVFLQCKVAMTQERISNLKNILIPLLEHGSDRKTQ